MSRFLLILLISSFGCLLSSEITERYASMFRSAWWRLDSTPRDSCTSVLTLRGGTADLVSADGHQELAASNLPPHKVRSNKLCEEGWALYGEGEALEAERLFLAALRENPENVEACSKLALLNEFDKGDLEKAEELYRKVRALEPSKSLVRISTIFLCCALIRGHTWADDVSYMYDFAVFLQESGSLQLLGSFV